MNNNFNWWLTKIDRFFAWMLLVSVILYLLTGYGMTKNLVDPALSTELHINILPKIFIVSFVIHSVLAIRLALIRWRVWNKASMALLIILYLVIFFGFGYVELFYKKSNTITPANTQNSSQTGDQPTLSQTQTPISDESKETQKTFTISELSKYNGQNGQKAYVAVDGIVYDVTSVFTAGKHFSHYAGQELTDAFYSRHVKSEITKYPVAGILK